MGYISIEVWSMWNCKSSRIFLALIFPGLHWQTLVRYQVSSKILTVSSKSLSKLMARHNTVSYVDTESSPLHLLIIFIYYKKLNFFFVESFLRYGHIKKDFEKSNLCVSD